MRRLSVLSLLLATTVIVCLAQDESVQPQSTPSEASSVDANEPPPQKPFLKRLFSVEAITATLPGAILQQYHDWPSEWGKKSLGFEKRTASLYAQFVLGLGIEAGVKAVHPEDTRYRRRGRGNFFARTSYVVEHTVLARKDDGHLTVAYSMPANAYGSWALATLWSPREYRNAESIFEWGSAGVGTVALTNFFREFWPDIRGVFHKKKAAPAVSVAAEP